MESAHNNYQAGLIMAGKLHSPIKPIYTWLYVDDREISIMMDHSLSGGGIDISEPNQ
jgi:hypothetical protein